MFSRLKEMVTEFVDAPRGRKSVVGKKEDQDTRRADEDRKKREEDEKRAQEEHILVWKLLNMMISSLVDRR